MTEPLSAPQNEERVRSSEERETPPSALSPSGPAGGYAAISIGRWWQRGRAVLPH